MSLVRVHDFSISLDGFGTGEGQTRELHFGHAGGPATPDRGDMPARSPRSCRRHR